jgi:hypothetical protein
VDVAAIYRPPATRSTHYHYLGRFVSEFLFDWQFADSPCEHTRRERRVIHDLTDVRQLKIHPQMNTLFRSAVTFSTFRSAIFGGAAAPTGDIIESAQLQQASTVVKKLSNYHFQVRKISRRLIDQ